MTPHDRLDRCILKTDPVFFLFIYNPSSSSVFTFSLIPPPIPHLVPLLPIIVPISPFLIFRPIRALRYLAPRGAATNATITCSRESVCDVRWLRRARTPFLNP